MATFSQAFLQGLLRPSYEEGLFTAARGIGQAPGLKRQQQQQQEEMRKLRGMGAVERAEFMAGRARTPEELMQAEASKNAALKQSGLESLRGLEAARQAAKTIEEKERIEKIMARVAVQAGVDPASISGRTQAERVRELNLEEAMAAQEKRLDVERSKSLISAWTRMGEKDRKLFKDNLSADDQLLIDNAELKDLERQKRIEEIEAWQVSKDAPLPVTSVEDIIDSLADGNVKDALKADLDAVAELIPEEGKEYSYAGQRSKLAAQLKAINERAFRAVVAEDSARIADERFDRNVIRQVESDIATYRPTKPQVTAKAQELEDALDRPFVPGVFETKAESLEVQAEQLLIKEYEERQKARLKILVPSYERSGSSEEVAESFSDEQEDLITANMNQYGKTREEVIAALKKKGML